MRRLGILRLHIHPFIELRVFFHESSILFPDSGNPRGLARPGIDGPRCQTGSNRPMKPRPRRTRRQGKAKLRKTKKKALIASWPPIFSRKFRWIPKSTKPSATTTSVELLAVDPNYQWAKDITYRHEVWQLEFEFKPMRMIYVDIPQPSGRMQRKLIWYMVYTVKNTGKVLVPAQDKNLSYEKELTDKQKVYRIKEEDQAGSLLPRISFGGEQSPERGGWIHQGLPRSGDTRGDRSDPDARGSEPEIAHHGRDVPGDRRRRNPMGRSDLGRYRSANSCDFPSMFRA